MITNSLLTRFLY